MALQHMPPFKFNDKVVAMEAPSRDQLMTNQQTQKRIIERNGNLFKPIAFIAEFEGF